MLFDMCQAQHDWKNIGGVTVKFKSDVTAILREIAHLTIIGSGSGYFSDPKIRSRCVIYRARNRIQIFTEAASNAWLRRRPAPPKRVCAPEVPTTEVSTPLRGRGVIKSIALKCQTHNRCRGALPSR
jgi:hypothetical protein